MIFHKLAVDLTKTKNNPMRGRLGRADYEPGDWAFYAIAIAGGVAVFWLTFH